MKNRVWGRVGLVVALAFFASSGLSSDAAAVTRGEAIDIVTNALILGMSNEHEIVAYAQQLPLQAGDQVFPGMEASPGDTIDILGETWFIFIDDHTMDRFSHPCRFAFVDAAGMLMWIGAQAWPVVNGVEQWSTVAELTDLAIAADEIIFGYDNLMFEVEPPPSPAGSTGEPEIEFSDAISDFYASSGANDGAIVCGGTNDARDNQGVDKMTNKLKGAPTSVPDAKMHSKKNCTKQDFCDAIDAIAANPPLDKLYIAFIGHGGKNDGTPQKNWYLWFKNGNGKMTGKELRDKLKKTKAKKICIVIEACYSGCLIPDLVGAADSVEVATAADKNSTSRSWTSITYRDVNGNNRYDRGTDIILSTTITNHYWDSFIGCIDASRNWKQTHDWAVADIDSADSAHQKPRYGAHGKRVVTNAPNRIVVTDQTFKLNLPPSSPPQVIEVDIITDIPVAGGILPLQVIAGLNGAFPLIDPLAPGLGFEPLLGPPIFDIIVPNNSGIDGISPDFWIYEFQSPTPPHLEPGDFPIVRLPVDLLPIEGTFTVDSLFQPPIPPLFIQDPTFNPIPFDFAPGDFTVIPIPNEFPELQQVIMPGLIDPLLITLTNPLLIPLLPFDPEGDPLNLILEQGPPGAVILPPDPVLGGFELMIQGIEMDSKVVIRIDDGVPRAAKAAPDSHEPPNLIEFNLVLVPPPCSCPTHADPQVDGVTNVTDVVKSINVAFRNFPAVQDAGCAFENTDVSCDAVTSVIDVVKFINVAFRNFDPATQFCDPCAP